MYLCIDPTDLADLTGSLVNTQAECIGYIAPLSDPTLTGLTISDANQLIGATALLFAAAFIVRTVLQQLGYKQ